MVPVSLLIGYGGPIKMADLAIREANVESSKAQLEQAKLNVAYCHIVAQIQR
jgi:hypothetical protein